MKTSMICIAGKNDIAANILVFVVKCYGVENIVAIANKDDNGKHNWQKSLAATASLLGVKLISLEQAYSLPDLYFFSVEFDRIVIPARFNDRTKLYNIHFSLLPRYKGVYTAIWPILNGEEETGVTLHYMNEGIDTGAIIHQRKIPISLSDTSRDIYHKCLEIGYDILCEFIPKIISSSVSGTQQSFINSTYFGPKSIDFLNLIIDLRRTAFQVHNSVRAFAFQEYQLPSVLGRRVRASYITDSVSTSKPGVLISENMESFIISTIDFDLQLFKDYSTELLQAIEKCDIDQLSYFLPYVPEMEIRNKQGWTPLMMAAFNGNLPMVRMLVVAGANVNAITKKGTSVLMYAKTAAAHSGDLMLIEYLVASGADLTAVDETGKSVLDYAYLERNQAVINFLIERLSS